MPETSTLIAGTCSLCKHVLVVGKLERGYLCNFNNSQMINNQREFNYAELPAVQADSSCPNWVNKGKANYKSILIKKLYRHY